ncbi:MAG TPA: AmmeMemoRadiSam system protein B [Candidatus Sulfotelmatobacter sp.]
MGPIRHPAVAGRFYPDDPQSLREQVTSYLSAVDIDDESGRAAIGCMAPHAGYMYSGHVAGAVFRRLKVPERCIVLCPNHTGIGQALAIMSEGEWETPLGSIPIDSSLATELKIRFPLLREDNSAHRAEHGIEVELPFLQVLQSKLQFVPIAVGTGRFEVLEQLGMAIAETIAGQSESVLIVASSDMNHYEADAITRVKDHQAIERILTLDPRGLYDVVVQQAVSMCGFGPAVVMLTAAKILGAKTAEMVKYATSGDISGDRKMVVGYAGIIVI